MKRRGAVTWRRTPLRWRSRHGWERRKTRSSPGRALLAGRGAEPAARSRQAPEQRSLDAGPGARSAAGRDARSAPVRRRPGQRVPQTAPEPSAPQVRARMPGRLTCGRKPGYCRTGFRSGARPRTPNPERAAARYRCPARWSPCSARTRSHKRASARPRASVSPARVIDQITGWEPGTSARMRADVISTFRTPCSRTSPRRSPMPSGGPRNLLWTKTRTTRAEDNEAGPHLAVGPCDIVPGEALAEDTRFELVRGCPQHAFQACALGH